MKHLIIVSVTLFAMIYNQAAMALNFKTEMLPLLQMVEKYNDLRLDPTTIANLFVGADKKMFKELLIKWNVKELPEIKKVREGVYQMISDNNVVIFDEKNWNNKFVIVNKFALSLSKINDMGQLIKAIEQVLVKKPNKKISIIEIIKEAIIPSASADMGTTNLKLRGYSDPWYKSPYVIGAGLIAALGVGLLVYNNNKDKKSSTSKSAASEGAGGSADQVSGGSFAVNEVGASADHGFFAIEEFNGTLYAGSFGYAKRQMIYKVEPFGPVSPGFTVRESVCALREFKGMFIANTESDGEIYKSTDGSNWQKVHKGEAPVGCALAVHGDYIYAASANQNDTHKPSYIYRSSDGSSWEKVYDSGSKTEYIRELVSFGDSVYAFYVSGDKKNYMLKSSDGTNWTPSTTPARMFRGRVHNNVLYLTSAGSHSSSGGSGIWKFDGSNFTQLHSAPDKSHVSNIIGAGNDMIAITTKEWKGHGGGASMLVSCGGDSNWTEKKVFDETESWGLNVKDGAVYVGTKQDGGGGKIYKAEGICDGSSATDTASGSGTADPDAKSCSQVPGFVWKMNKQGHTAVVMSKGDIGCKAIVNGRSPNECKTLDGGDGRPFCRHYTSPSSFTSPATVEVNCNGAVKYKVNIPNTGSRCSYYPGGWGD